MRSTMYQSSTQSPNMTFENSYTTMMYGSIPEQEERRCWQLACCQNTVCCKGGILGCYVRDEFRPQWLQKFFAFTRSTPWVVVIYCFSVLLLFGPAMQSLIDTNERGDAVFLWLRVSMLVFFLVDILVRCLSEENYFVFSCRCRKRNRSAAVSGFVGANSVAGTTDTNKQEGFRFGSFLFWCDLISTLSILYDLSFINNHHFDTITHEIILRNGVPDHQQSSRLAINSLEVNILVVILRTARCARFVHSRAAVDFRNNLYMILSIFHSAFCTFVRSHTEAKQQSQEVDESLKSYMPTDNDNSLTSKKPQVTGVLATVQSEAEKVKDVLFPNAKASETDEMIESKIDAATKIQRLWRKRTELESDDEWERRYPQTSTRSGQSMISAKKTSSILSSFSLARSWGTGRRLTDSGTKTAKSATSGHTPGAILESFAEQNDDSKEIITESILDAFAESTSRTERMVDDTPKSRFQSRAGKGNNESQVGRDMRQLTGQRVAIATLLILFCTVLFTYTETTTTQIKTMAVLHTQTTTPQYIERSIEAAISSSVPMLYEYYPSGGSKVAFTNPNVPDPEDITPRNRVNITITSFNSQDNITITSFNSQVNITMGLFDNSASIKHEATVDIIATVFVILFWFTGLISFSGPVAMLVITPVEQMVRLLGMLSRDPLGYQSTLAYKQFLDDEERMTQHTGWSKEILSGMETSFLKSTILRIGSLMKVGFGSAGVQIIQNNLETGQNQNTLTLNAQGISVSCIFLFCDIRQFTDATEQLQEEVFVFTNRIAAVVHSYCNSYGGAANKNIGDAFLVSWSLDEKNRSNTNGPLQAKNNQADKALLSVIKICIALAYDNFFLEPLSSAAIGRLKTKLGNRSGPVVQIGFGLHAGRAVQGAIGSQRKIDASYVSESVELAEYLESSTKKYGLKVLMSGEFHKLLHARNQDRCRKIDQLLMRGDDEFEIDEVMNLFTFDMDIDALQRPSIETNTVDNVSQHGSFAKRGQRRRQSILRRRNKGSGQKSNSSSNDRSRGETKKSDDGVSLGRPSSTAFMEFASNMESNVYEAPSNLVLPKGPILYSHNAWFSPEMKRMRRKYVQGELFFEKYKMGLEAFYKKDWVNARKHFRHVADHFDDGPSKYFLAQIDKNKGIPPKDFRGYGIA